MAKSMKMTLLMLPLFVKTISYTNSSFLRISEYFIGQIVSDCRDHNLSIELYQQEEFSFFERQDDIWFNIKAYR